MSEFSDRYLLLNSLKTKKISIVIDIEGADLLSNRPIYTYLRYGDKIYYGENYVYGGLRRLEGVRDILSLEGSSLTLSQKLETEQGRASISQLSFSFIDKDGYMTKLCSPGLIIKDIIGQSVRVFIGYDQCSYPEDYVQIFRGRVSGITSRAGLYYLTFSDANINRRQNVFNTAKTKLTQAITPTDTTINLLSTAFMYQGVLLPDGTYDCANPWAPNGTYNVLTPKQTGYRMFMKIEDEWIEYGPAAVSGTQVTNVLRGARGTTPVAHALGEDVEFAIEITDHAFDIALKLMLSGYGGDWISGVKAHSIVSTGDPVLSDQYNAIVLPSGKDAVRDYGLVENDFVTISNASNALNNGTGRIVRFGDLFDEPNRLIYITKTLYPEPSSPATLSFRSQFDTYPKECGAKLTPQDVDVATHIKLKNDFLSGTENTLKFFITSSESAKSFIESECYLPVAAYSLTKRGKLSVGYTVPPIATQNITVLDENNILEPQNITVQRGINTRKCFTEIDFDYNPDDTGRFRNSTRTIDVEALDQLRVNQVLPIKSRGLRPQFNAQELIDKRTRFLLSRYRIGAMLINLKVNWEAASLIEVGDTVALKDEGKLQIANIMTGERNLGTMLFEVNDRQLDIKSGTAQIQLISGVRADISDRYAVFSPSSYIDSYGVDLNGNEYLIIKDSFGSKNNEALKWKDFVGNKINIHNEDYSFQMQVDLLRIDAVNNYKLIVAGITTPIPTNCLIDIPKYPDTTRKTDNSIYKAYFAHFSKIVKIVSGSSQTQFDVSASDLQYFIVGAKLEVHKEDWSSYSSEVRITEIVGNTIKVDKPLGFVPDNTYYISGLGFKDGQGYYRYI